MNVPARPERFGFRMVGQLHTPRRLVEYWPAFVAYCQCDVRAKIDQGGFLSPYQYDSEVESRIVDGNSLSLDVRGFGGVTWSRYLWFDIDDADLDNGLHQCQRLVSLLLERYGIEDGDLLVFFSGSKGFHVGLPTSIWGPIPSKQFASACRSMASSLAAAAGVVIDSVIYQTVQPFRAPNSRHAKTGLYKRLVSIKELERCDASTIRKLASRPHPFEPPDDPTSIHRRAVEDWAIAESTISRHAVESRVGGAKPTKLNRSTLAFIRDGAEEGERNRSLYSAAANLFEFGCPLRLASALLAESALNSGLPPSEVERVVENAFSKLKSGYEA